MSSSDKSKHRTALSDLALIVRQYTPLLQFAQQQHDTARSNATTIQHQLKTHIDRTVAMATEKGGDEWARAREGELGRTYTEKRRFWERIAVEGPGKKDEGGKEAY